VRRRSNRLGGHSASTALGGTDLLRDYGSETPTLQGARQRLERQKASQESADVRLPSDRLLDARQAKGEYSEQNIDPEPDQQKCQHPRIAKAGRERGCRHQRSLGAISPQLERAATLEHKPCRRGHGSGNRGRGADHRQ
jgi:hypothetical protein